MRVLQVTTHMNIGGIGNYILTLSRALKARGVEVIVVSSGGGLEDELKKCGIRHIYLNIRTKNWISSKVFSSVFKLNRIVKEEKIDIIHAHSRVSQVAAFFASRLTAVPHVTTCHGFFRKRLRGVFDTWGRKVVAISGAVEEHLKRDLGVRQDRIKLIPSGVDADRFAKHYSRDEVLALKRSLGLKGGPVIGTVGRLSPVKGQRFLIKAMESILRKAPDAQCLIIGDGEEKGALAVLARSLGAGGSVRFINSLVDTETLLPAIDVFVFPSIKEGLGIALLEALAAGRPSVASRIGGIENIIEDRSTGLLTEPGDADEIALAVISLLEDPKLAARLGEKGRRLVRQRFSLDSMAVEMLGLYEKVLKG